MSEVVVSQAGIAALLRGPDIGADLARRAIKVANAAKRFCPVDTGRLRASIAWEMASDASGPVAIVGTNVEYAPFVELGTRYMAAQPFLRPALNEAK